AAASKSTNVPWVAMFLVALYAPQLLRRRRRRAALLEGALAAFLLGVVLLPWMIAMYRTAGTALYPVLGRGYSGTTHDGIKIALDAETLLRRTGDWLARPLVISVLAVIALNLRSFRIHLRARPIIPAVCLASLTTALLLEIQLPSFERYQVP